MEKQKYDDIKRDLQTCHNAKGFVSFFDLGCIAKKYGVAVEKVSAIDRGPDENARFSFFGR